MIPILSTIIITALLLFFFTRYGVSSYPFLFLATSTLYLLIIPFSLDGYDIITGASALAGNTFYLAVLIYTIFYLIGIRLSGPFIVLKKENKIKYSYTFTSTLFKNLLFIFSSLFILYSINTRNVFLGTDYLFTILGFDLLLVHYFLTRNDRNNILNFIYAFIIICIFLYAGFRYRIALLVLSELIIFISLESSRMKKSIWLGIIFLFIVFLGSFA